MGEPWGILVSGVLSAGFAATVTAFFTSKASARKINAEAKKLEIEADVAEVDLATSAGTANIKGAEAAVLLMDASLTSAHREIERLNEARKMDQAYIDHLTKRVNELQELVDAAQNSAKIAQEYSETLRRELEEARTRMGD